MIILKIIGFSILLLFRIIIWGIFFWFILKKLYQLKHSILDYLFKLKNREYEDVFDILYVWGFCIFILIRSIPPLNESFSLCINWLNLKQWDIFKYYMIVQLFLFAIEIIFKIIFKYDKEWYDKNWINKLWRRESDKNSYNAINMITKNKYDKEWYDIFWYDKDWFNKKWLNEYWFRKDWKHSITNCIYDEEWYMINGFNENWYDREWYDKNWYDRDWYDRDCYDKEWYDKNWYNKDWYDRDWYDRNWYNEDWYNRNWYDKNWYDKNWLTEYWHDKIQMYRVYNKKLWKRELNYFNKWGIEWYYNTIESLIKNNINKYDTIIEPYLNVSDKNNKKLYMNDLFINKNDICYYNEKRELNIIWKWIEIRWGLSKLKRWSFTIIWNIHDWCLKNYLWLFYKYLEKNDSWNSRIIYKKLFEDYKNSSIKTTDDKKAINWKNKLKICSIASWSNWNCYYIWDDNEWILVDNWISYKMLTSRLNEVNININTIKWVFITHEHSDHIKWLWTFHKNNPDIPIYFNSRAFDWVKTQYAYDYKDWIININLKPVELWWFKIHPFKKVHDTNFPISYRVEFKWKNIWVFTDIWKVNKEFENQFSKCDAVFLESNHDRQTLRNCKNYSEDLKDRIRKNHLSNDEAYDLITDHAKKDLKLIILSHISKETNSNYKLEEIFWDLKNKYQIEIASREEVWKVFEI